MEKQELAERHPALPTRQSLSDQELESWLRNNAVQSFMDKDRSYYSDEEIAEFEHESSLNGREYNRLAAIKQMVSDICRKGTGDATEPITITIPLTVGSKMLEIQRRQSDDMVEYGFSEEEIEVFAIPHFEAQKMEFFDGEGKHYADRSRSMSARERLEYSNMIQMFGKKSEPDSNGDVANLETGEVLDGTNN